MKRTLITLNENQYPEAFRPYLSGARIYDSSCSHEARVIFLEKDEGYYLKSAPKGTLGSEAEMTRFFASRKLGAEVLLYVSEGEKDYLLTARVKGEDCTHAQYLGEPKRLCDTLARLLRELHETDLTDCPVGNRIEGYLETAARNYGRGMYDLSYLSPRLSSFSADEAYKFLCENGKLLKNDTLLHGDYCLPNVILDGWAFSGFIDLGNGGVGDRHIDLFWGAWTLNFNLKTDKYRERFFDAYGRDRIDRDLLDVVAAAEVFG